MSADETPLLALKGITKAFPGTLANDAIDLAIAPGEIHALLGENGAGKSTLVKIIYGVLAADSGETRWAGAPVRIDSPKAARGLGIGMVFQHFSLFDALTVAENIELGMDAAEDRHGLARRISGLAERYKLPLDPARHVYDLSIGEKQRIEIIRALLQDPRLLIMDEPTSVLTPQESEALTATLRRLAEEGRSILYISHKLGEVQALCDRATILRAGRVVAACNPAEESPRSIAELMIGARVATPKRAVGQELGKTRLAVEGLSAPALDEFGTTLHDISFAVRAGEVVGIAGVAGNGQSEIMSLLIGERLAPEAAMIRIGGRPVGRLGPNRRRALAAAFVPEERMGHAAVPGMDLVENAFLTARQRQRFTTRGVMRPARAARFAAAVCEHFGVRHPGIHHPARSLSGGNLQKFVMGREIDQEPEILIVNQPTWGIDTGAAALIEQAMIDLAGRGAAVVVISQDLDELLAICDRIGVMHAGRLSPARPTASYSIEEIGLLMTGYTAEPGGDAGRTAA